MLKDKMEAREINEIYMIQPNCLHPQYETFNSYIFLFIKHGML